MHNSKNKEVQKYLENILNDDEQKYQILQELRKIVFSIDSSVSEKIMYGGIIFTVKSDIGWIFVYKNHVSFEFSDWYKLKDSDNILEWNWKFRRHVKMEDFSDIWVKNVLSFVKQAIEISN